MRILLSKRWLAEPEFYTHHVWGVFHFYLIAFVIWITGDQFTAPYILNILLSSFLAPIVYHTALELFDNKRGALMAVFIFLASPLLFRISLLSLSEMPFLLCLGITILYATRGMKYGNRPAYFGITSGLALAVASGFRLEAWIILPMIAGIIAFSKRYKMSIYFMFAAASYPFFWMFTSYLSTGDAFYSIHESSNWNIIFAGLNEDVDRFVLAARLMLHPLMFMFNITPWIFLLVMYALWKLFKERRLELFQVLWFVPMTILLLLYEFKTFIGDMNLHARYGSTIILMFIPMIGSLGLIFKRQWINYLIITTGIMVFSFSFKYNSIIFEKYFSASETIYKGLFYIRNYSIMEDEAIPILRNEKALEYDDIISKNISEDDGLILDFIGWNECALIILNSGVPFTGFNSMMENVLLKNDDIYQMDRISKEHKKGILLLRKESPKWNIIVRNDTLNMLTVADTIELKVQPIFEDESIEIFHFSRE